MKTYFDYYGDIGLQRTMITDEVRTEAFARALAELVTPNMRVLDVGTGTGILAMFAAKAGAEHVFAIDQARIIDDARVLVQRNNLQQRITLIEGKAAELKLDAPVDLLVSEWLGEMAFEENMLDDVLLARDHNLKPDGLMVPAEVTLLLAPISDARLYYDEAAGFWRDPHFGLDLSYLEARELTQSRSQRTIVSQDALLAPPAPLLSLDLKRAQRQEPWQRGKVTFVLQHAAECHGFLGWFEVKLSPNVTLDTGPCSTPTHWMQTYFPFTPGVQEPGVPLEVAFELARIPHSPRGMEVVLETLGQRRCFALD